MRFMTQISSHFKVALLMGMAGLSTSGTATEQIALSPAQKIEVGVVSWVSQQQALKASDLSMQPLDPRLRVPSCSVDLKYDFPFSNAETVRVRCAQPVWQLYVRVTSGGGTPSVRFPAQCATSLRHPSRGRSGSLSNTSRRVVRWPSAKSGLLTRMHLQWAPWRSTRRPI